MVKIEALGATTARSIVAANLGAEYHGAPSAACVCVGDEIEALDDNTLRGHGTQVMDDKLVASVCGVIDRVNKLVTVKTLHRRYSAEIGDVVVGRVTEVASKRWRIDLQSQQEAQLMLSAVSLPGGVQRRRTAEDELNMRSVFKEGDLVSAEVQAIHHDGTVMLHTRSTKYGLLARGRAVTAPAQLVRRQRHHFQYLKPAGVDIILGCNGLVWVTPHMDVPSVAEDGAAPAVELPPPSRAEREAVARASQAMLALAQLGLNLHGDSISKVVMLSREQGVRPADMVAPTFLAAVAAQEEIQRQALADGLA